MTGSWSGRVGNTCKVAPAASRWPRRGCALLAAVGAFLAAAGCESSTSGRGTAAPPQSGGGAGQQSGAPTTTVTPTVAATSAPSAADGPNVSACADGRCEVSVPARTAIPVPARVRVRDLKVTAVTGDRVTLTGHDIGNSSSGVCTGQCDSSSSNGAFTITLGADSQAIQNGLSITVERITGGVAVLKLEPAG